LEDIQRPIQSAQRGSTSQTTDSPHAYRALLEAFSRTAVKHLVCLIRVVQATMHAVAVVVDVPQVVVVST